jgi:hypothetical protein
MIVTLLFLFVIGGVLLSLIPACISDFKSRRIPVGYWKPAAYVAIPVSFIMFVVRLISGDVDIGLIAPMVMSAIIVIIIALLCGYFELFGGADSIAISIIALTSFHFGKTTYVDDSMYFMTAFMGYFILISIVIYGLIIGKNIVSRAIFDLPPGHRILGCIATRIPFAWFKWYHGVVMETVGEQGNRSFLPLNRSTFTSERYLTTTIYAHQDEPWAIQYRDTDAVWVSCLVPFIIPITIAYCITLVAMVFL